ncbi:MAG: electron transfer flavoprotein-ubiquinone oxidoreductase [Planctomycetes bacterium]|nr:electron transfer flavoprotein-ubiquinone oxidoreductase [Planctomycetota bacterium]
MTEHESFPVDVLVVGAGPAGLCFAIRLGQLLKERGLEKSVMVIDKAPEFGHHTLSGAVLDPRALLELEPQAPERGFPVEAECTQDALWWMSEKSHRVLKGITLPPPFRNQGKWIVSASAAVEWLAEQADAFEAVDVYPGTAGAEVLYSEDGAVRGVRTVDQGRNLAGEQKPNFEPGMDIEASLVVFAEGTRGSLAKDLIQKQGLDANSNPQIWGVGVKEIWETQENLTGTVIHTGGWPLSSNTYGGGWIYGLPQNRLSMGFVTGMDHGDASFDYHAVMQAWKAHPSISALLEGGKLLNFGAKTVPEGGLYSMPKMYGNGFLMVGDSAGFMNSQRLKGVHLAMKSGMLAAETTAEALSKQTFDEDALKEYRRAFEASWAYRELHQVRNFRQPFQKGMLSGVVQAGISTLTRGLLPGGVQGCESDHHRYQLRNQARVEAPAASLLVQDKLTSVYHSGTIHEEDQPCHLLVTDPSVCTDRCTEEYGNPCQHFCPAAVYEWQEQEGLQINFSNCVHCKTCDIADPYQIIDWVVPEGGGPIYSSM